MMFNKDKVLQILSICYFAWFVISVLAYVYDFHPSSLFDDSETIERSVSTILSSLSNFVSLALIGPTLANITDKISKLTTTLLSLIAGLIVTVVT